MGVPCLKDPALPQVGETWRKRSFPLPTVVHVIGRHGDGTLTVKYGRRSITLPIEQFVGQGFERHDAALAAGAAAGGGEEVDG